MPTRNPAVDRYMQQAKTWPTELRTLRALLLTCDVEETLKWAKPCYVHAGRNVAILQPFQRHCALMFFQGALLDDPHGLLREQGPNSRSARRLEFTSKAEIDPAVVRTYVEAAIALAQEGRTAPPTDDPEPELPPELTRALRADRTLARAWDALTPGRRRSWILHVSGAKQSSTRSDRVERSIPAILAGKRKHDR